jgi:hypothetical protein
VVRVAREEGSSHDPRTLMRQEPQLSQLKISIPERGHFTLVGDSILAWTSLIEPLKGRLNIGTGPTEGERHRGTRDVRCSTLLLACRHVRTGVAEHHRHRDEAAFRR